MPISVIVLAAGQGKRMQSRLPKVLHPLAGKPLLAHVVQTAHALEPTQTYVVIGHGGDVVQDQLSHLDVVWKEQREQLGTGHAVAQALPDIPPDHDVLILYGDVPLIEVNTLSSLMQNVGDDQLGLLTAVLDSPAGYGRIVRAANGEVQCIVEEKDCTDGQRDINEINTGIMAVQARHLQQWVKRLNNNNAQGEYYLTDIIAMAAQDGIQVATCITPCATRVQGVNDRKQLALLERFYQIELANYYMEQGVSFADPSRVDIRGNLTVGQDIKVDINVIIEGTTSLGDDVIIGPNTTIKNSQIGDNVEILANCVIEDAVIGAHARIGPFARIRPETRLHEYVHVGNFVEIKKSEIAQGSKVNHLSYIGDTQIGSRVNVGAGTITCNYDGANKHKTIIEDNVFIGSGTQLIAPITVGAGATIAAGSTLAKQVEAGGLTIGRNPAKHVSNWKRPKKPAK